MDYEKVVCEAAEYIHTRHGDEITIADVARHVHVSPSYCATVFRTLTGYTVQEYLSRYRLSQVARALLETDERIVMLTYEHGFSSQQALTRSFTLVYGIAPAQFRRTKPPFKPFPFDNMILKRGFDMDLHKVFEKVHFEKKDSFFVAGIETDIHYNDASGTHSIGNVYARWNGENLIDSIPDQVNDQLTYGMTYDNTEDSTAKYMAAVEVSTLDNLPVGFSGRRFNACEYAVFDCTLDDETSGRFFRYFFTTFLKENNLRLPDPVTTKRGVTYSRYPIYEVYDRNFKDVNSKIKLYAPIVRE